MWGGREDSSRSGNSRLIREAAPVAYSPRYDVWATGRHAQIELMAVHGHEKLPLRMVPA